MHLGWLAASAYGYELVIVRLPKPYVPNIKLRMF